MAFLVAGLVYATVKVVQDGVQAHRDVRSIDGPQQRVNDMGESVKRGGVYGMVVKHEEKRMRKKGKGTVSWGCLSTPALYPPDSLCECWVWFGGVMRGASQWLIGSRPSAAGRWRRKASRTRPTSIPALPAQ